MQWRRVVRLLLRPLLPLFLAFSICEFAIYYVSLWGCEWAIGPEDSLHAMLLADTHLLGVRSGHWFDKLRREWQMYRSFQTAITLLAPNAVFFLGDLFDEGQWSNEELFSRYANRFDELFAVPEGTRVFVVAGNHDLGFHYAINPRRMEWFEQRFSRQLVDHVELSGNHFVLINSMAMHGDGCRLCDSALKQLKALQSRFDCARNESACTGNDRPLQAPYSQPIIMQHFPLFRTSDALCDETDEAPSQLKSSAFRPLWDCVSNESTHIILDSLHPRAAFSGHTHFGCRTWWPKPYSFWEYTISSFSWRNTPLPSFLLLTVSPRTLQVEKCFITNENTVIALYVLAALVSLTVLCVDSYVLLKRSRNPCPKID